MTDDLIETLTRFRQEHLLAFVDELSPSDREGLERQLSDIDFRQLQELVQSGSSDDHWTELSRRAQPPAAIRRSLSGPDRAARELAVQRGEAALGAGQIGLIMVAGGQGSRLGFDHPKGMYPLGPVSGRTLFQIHLDKLMAIGKRHGVVIPLYIMTSPATDLETVRWLDDHDWFGYPREFRQTFCQGTMPAVDAESGEILLSEKGKLFLGPDGHGGMLAALNQSGCLQDIETRGLQQVFYCQVDNPLCQICDPATIGYHLESGSEMSSQGIPKTGPLQRVGNLVSIDSRIHVIEYSDLPDDVARQTDPDGSLVLWAGSIAVHVFDVPFLKRMTEHADALPFHLARKKVPFIDRTGQRVDPDKPNAIKFERFIFDLLPMASHSIVVEVEPAEAFSPVKNAAGESTSTVLTARQAMMAQARRALKDAGVDVPDPVHVEISASLLAEPEKLRERMAGHPAIHEPVFIE